MQFHDFSKAVDISQSKTALTVLCNDLQFKAVLVTNHGIIAGAWQPHDGNFGHLAICRDVSDWCAISYDTALSRPCGNSAYRICKGPCVSLPFNVYISYDNYIGNSQSTRELHIQSRT